MTHDFRNSDRVAITSEHRLTGRKGGYRRRGDAAEGVTRPLHQAGGGGEKL